MGSPDGNKKNQIDIILSETTKKITNIEILNIKTFSSDHRLVRSTYNLDKPMVSRAKYCIKRPTISSEESKQEYLETLKQKAPELIWDKYDNVESYYGKVESVLIQSLQTSRNAGKIKNIISDETKKIIKRRSELQHKQPKNKEEKKELTYLYKSTNKLLKKDYEKYRMGIIEQNLRKSRSQKRAFKQLNTNKTWIPKLKVKTSLKIVETRLDIIKTATDFYRDLYRHRSCRSTTRKLTDTVQIDTMTLPINPFNETEILKQIERLKPEKSPGPDSIPNEALMVGKAMLLRPLTILFNKILQEQKTPMKWAESRITLLYKKGDPTDVNNYRPISLLPTVYKLFAACLGKRIETDIEIHQPVEQAGFRKGYSTIDHIHTLDQIIEKHQELQQPLYLAFIDYAKAFDSISHESIWEALDSQSVPKLYIEIIKYIYSNSESRVKLDRLGPVIKICRGAKQGDPLSPKIFIAVLQHQMENLDWEKKGIYINGKFLSNLRFADDIVLFSKTSKELEEMIVELCEVSENIGLKLNTSKTKVATNSIQSPIMIYQKPLEYVESYLYLGKQVSFSKSRHRDEIERRINMTWKKFWSQKETLKSKLSLKLKKIVMDSCLLPCLSYGSQTWIFNEYTRHKIQTTQRAMERSLLNIKLKDKQRSETIRKKTNVTDALKYSQSLKWKWAGHVARLQDKRWTRRATAWSGPTGKRARGRPQERWADELRKVAGQNWIEKAGDRTNWKKLEEAYTRKGP